MRHSWALIMKGYWSTYYKLKKEKCTLLMRCVVVVMLLSLVGWIEHDVQGATCYRLPTIWVSRSFAPLVKKVAQLATIHPTYESRAVALFINDFWASLGFLTQLSSACAHVERGVVDESLHWRVERSPMQRYNTGVFIIFLIGIKSSGCGSSAHHATRLITFSYNWASLY